MRLNIAALRDSSPRPSPAQEFHAQVDEPVIRMREEEASGKFTEGGNSSTTEKGEGKKYV